MPTLGGRCTPDGTRRFRDRFPGLASDHFTQDGERWLSSMGLGTYSAMDNPSLARQLSAAVQSLVTRGCNVIDTAPNYADGNAERAVGEGIAALQAGGLARRDELFVATKAGIVPPSLIGPLAAGAIDGLGHVTVLTDGLCFDPAYLRWQVGVSRQRLGLETVDCLFLHNLDAFRLARGREECRQTFAACVEVLEELVLRGWIDAYGVSAWSGFRQAETAPDYLALADLCAMVRAIAGSDGHFRFIQAPIGLWALEAILLRNQTTTGTEGPVSLLRAAHNLGLTVIANGALLQGELVGAPALDEDHGISGLTGPLQAIQFSRSIPSVASVLVGMMQPAHWAQNASLFALPKADLRHLGLVRRSPTTHPADLSRAVVGSRSGSAGRGGWRKFAKKLRKPEISSLWNSHSGMNAGNGPKSAFTSNRLTPISNSSGLNCNCRPTSGFLSRCAVKAMTCYGWPAKAIQ